MVPCNALRTLSPVGPLAGEDDVVGADADEEAAAGGLIAVGNFELLTVAQDLADAPLRVGGCDFHVEDVFKAVLFDQWQDLGMGRDGEEVSVGDDLAAVEDYYLAGEFEDFGDRVTDVENGDLEGVADVAQVGDDAVFEALIERSQRLVHQ